MNFHALSPYIRVAMQSVIKAPFQISRRILFDYELIYLEAGMWELIFENQTFICREGDVLLICPGQVHTIRSIDGIDVSQPHIHFDLQYDRFSERVYVSFKDKPSFSAEERKMIRPNLLEGKLKTAPALKISEEKTFLPLFFEVIREFSEKTEGYQLRCKGKMLCLLELLFRDNLNGEEAGNMEGCPPIALLKQYIDHNYQNRMSLDGLAMQFHYDKYYLERNFKKEYGSPVIQYYHKVRLDAAKTLLQTYTVTEVAQQLSFSSIYEFSRFFKQRTGISPAFYKNEK